MTVIEIMARAIGANKRGLQSDDPAVDRVWTGYCGQARAALTALRDAGPSEGMLDAGLKAYGIYPL